MTLEDKTLEKNFLNGVHTIKSESRLIVARSSGAGEWGVKG